MTEAEWMRCSDPLTMLKAIYQNEMIDMPQYKIKTMQISLAVCQSLWPRLLCCPTWAVVLNTAKKYAQGQVDDQTLLQAHHQLLMASQNRFNSYPDSVYNLICDFLICSHLNFPLACARVWPTYLLMGTVFKLIEDYDYPIETHNKRMCNLIRCILGNPFMTNWARTSFKPEWRTPQVKGIALKIRGNNDKSLTISLFKLLADALEEAGCTRALIIDHCRQHSSYVSEYCWVITMILDESEYRST
jgi:hypothetical protein